LAVGSGTGDIYVRDVVVGRFTAHLPDHRGRVLMLGFPANPDRLISAAADGTARIWSLSEQRQIAEVRIDASLHCAAYDPTTGRLLAASAAGLAMVTVDLPCPGQ
jgi:WD40 repeat protein